VQPCCTVSCFSSCGFYHCRKLPKRGTPFLQVQFCLTEQADAGQLKEVLKAIAREEKPQFFDRSADTNAELRALSNLPLEVARSFSIMNVAVRSGDGHGLSGGNSGLPSDQVSFGFSPDTAQARAFAQ
jgi:hypothetical protein